MYIDLEQGTILPVQEGRGRFTATVLSLSTAGMILSVLCLLLLLITAGVLREWRKNYKNQLLIQFMLARCAYTFTRFFFDLQTIFTFCGGHSCIIYLDELIMIYTEILLVAWMFMFSKHMYRSLVIVFNFDTPNIWKLSAVTWIGSMAVTFIMYGIFMVQTDRDLMFFLLYLAIVKWPLLISNAVTLILILKSLIKRNDNTNNSGNNFRLIVVMSIMIFFFCFQQLFVDVYKIIYIVFRLRTSLLILINLVTTYHCAFTILFWVFGNANTRQMWKSKISRQKVPLSPTISLNSNCTTVNSIACDKL